MPSSLTLMAFPLAWVQWVPSPLAEVPKKKKRVFLCRHYMKKNIEGSLCKREHKLPLIIRGFPEKSAPFSEDLLSPFNIINFLLRFILFNLLITKHWNTFYIFLTLSQFCISYICELAEFLLFLNYIGLLKREVKLSLFFSLCVVWYGFLEDFYPTRYVSLLIFLFW